MDVLNIFPRSNNMKNYRFGKYNFFDNEIIMKGFNTLTNFQKNILVECLNKKSGALSIPVGTGKTIISIVLGLIQSNHNNGSILVVLPKSLISNYVDEIKKFFGPLLEYEILHKEYNKNIDNWQCTKKITITTTDVLSPIYRQFELDIKYVQSEYSEKTDTYVNQYQILTEPLLNGLKTGVKSIYGKKWACLLVDECQEYYNFNLPKSRSVCCVYTETRWLLSGTVLQEPEKLFGYYLLLDDKTVPRNAPEFKMHIKSKDYRGFSNTLVHRSENEDFVPPTINKRIISHSLSEEEAKIYVNVKSIINQLNKEHERNKLNNDKEKTKKFSSYILVMITYLRQCIVCPIIPIASVAISVSERETRNDLSEIFMDSINNIGLDGWLNDLNSIKSSRIKTILEKLKEHKNEKVIIFSCHRTFLDILRSFIKGRNTFSVLGSMKIEERNRELKRFSDSANGVALLTYDIGGSGTNLQHCHNVFIADYWWNAGKIFQATGRVLRRGQESDTVNVYFFTSNTGIENAMFKIQKDKLDIIEELTSGATTKRVDKMTTKNILKLLKNEDNINILKDIQRID